ncbi:MAG TPA: adenylate kinase [Candidatus Nanoarchaeia archaeon]|nr:adenylate kinase [Candidatus Nanoarchaeia archaeon]
MQKNFVILGPQGSGKGTQAKLIADKYKLPHISTGDIFRQMRTQNTGLGRKVKELIDAGNLVPDEITNQIIVERLAKPDCKKGFVLDGYPRNLGQAEFLDKNYPVTKVILLEISEGETIKRMAARRICSSCKADYNIIYILPKKEGICDKCGGKLIQRDDDKPEAIRKRLETYNKETTPLISYYDKKGVLLRVNGEQPIEKVFRDVVAGIK